MRKKKSKLKYNTFLNGTMNHPHNLMHIHILNEDYVEKIQY